MTDPSSPEPGTPWCCTGRGYVSECPLCPQYGTSLLDPCPGHPDTDTNRQTITTARLHAERRHPGWEYRTTTGPRKQWDNPEEPPHDEYGEPEPGWEANVDAGRPGQGWDRFDYHEEAYWRRRKPTLLDATSLEGSLTVASSAIQAVQIAQPPVISARGDHGLIWAVHPDGRIELGEHYTPDEAATSFWEAVKRLQPTLEQTTGIRNVEAKLRAGAFRDGADRIRRTDLPDDYIDTFDAGAGWAATLMDQAAREADPK